MVPETINEYQKDCFKTLIERLKNYHTDIEFDDWDGYAEALFEETYNDSKKKLDTPVKEKDGLFKDKYNILKYKNNSLQTIIFLLIN